MASFFMNNDFGIYVGSEGDPIRLPVVRGASPIFEEFNDFGIYLGSEGEPTALPAPTSLTVFGPQGNELIAILHAARASFTGGTNINYVDLTATLRAARGDQGTFTGTTGGSATFVTPLLMQQFYADDGLVLVPSLLAPVAQFQMQNSAIISILATLRRPRVDLDVLNSFGEPTIFARLLNPRASFALASESFISLVSPLLRPYPRFTATPGRVMTLAAALPFGVFSATAYPPYLITITGDLPRAQLEASLKAAIAELWRCWVVNVREQHHPVTEYDNFHFNSMALFDGKILAAGPDGLFVLDLSGDDDSVKIPAKIKTGELDYDQSYLFRLPRIYVGGSSEKGMEFRTIITSDGQRVYRLPASSNDAIQQRRVPVGRGPKSRYWQLEVSNIDGGDMTLESIILYPEQTQRRIK